MSLAILSVQMRRPRPPSREPVGYPPARPRVAATKITGGEHPFRSAIEKIFGVDRWSGKIRTRRKPSLKRRESSTQATWIWNSKANAGYVYRRQHPVIAHPMRAARAAGRKCETRGLDCQGALSDHFPGMLA